MSENVCSFFTDTNAIKVKIIKLKFTWDSAIDFVS